MARANATLIIAPMGEGKTVTITAIIVDDYFKNVYAIESPEGFLFPVEPYKRDIVKLLPLPEDPDKKPKIIQIPKGYMPKSTLRVFANYHLYGIEYLYASPEKVLSLINTGAISHGKWVIDESYISGEARRGQNTLNLVYTWLAQQVRKRGIELFLLAQNARFIDWRFRDVARFRILCRYNEKTQIARLLFQNLSRGTEKILHYYTPYYWKYYNTNEIPPIPTPMIRGAAKSTDLPWLEWDESKGELSRMTKRQLIEMIVNQREELAAEGVTA